MGSKGKFLVWLAALTLTHLQAAPLFDWKFQNCSKKVRIGDSLFPTRPKTDFFYCEDNTVSFNQPKSRDRWGWEGWEGYCGQVTASNLTAMYCQRYIDPKLFDAYAMDQAPGTAPSTLEVILNKVFSEQSTHNPCPEGKWKTMVTSNNPYQFVSTLQRRLFQKLKSSYTLTRKDQKKVSVNPLVLLISEGPTSYHYITLVDMHTKDDDRYGCEILANSYGAQYTMTCEKLIRYTTASVMGYYLLSFQPD